ncbi:hypothetical protein PT276_02435 [Orbaceae bacterium ESL0721]|nr:hypothetical protein [Orbaceae bacterium ESL0721]
MHQTPDTRHQTPDTRHQTPDTRHQTPDTRHQTPDNQNRLNKLELLFSVLPFTPVTILSPLLLLLSIPSTSSAALSAITNQTVIGSKPFITLDGGQTKIEHVDALFDITLSDGTTYSKTNNPSAPDKPIELPDQKQSFENITTLIPKTLREIAIDDLVHEPYNFWGDDNGDGVDEVGISATGNLTMTITDVWGKSVNRSTILSVCNAPYKVTLAASGTLSTQYGDPRSSDLGSADVTYYFRPKVGLPVTCFAQPNLDYSSTHPHPMWPYTQMDGPASQWNPDRGYILQSLNNPSKNFPTMGSYGLFFNLILGDGVGGRITYSKSPTSSIIDLLITDGGNGSAKVMLIGPRNGASPAEAQRFVPTTFILYSDAAKSNAIYSFTIGKWFIAKPGESTGWNPNFCRDTYGGGYRTPNTVELSNANDPLTGWNGGLAGQPSNFQRRIGGGLFSEWGNMDNYGRWGRPSIYINSDFDDVWYWAAEEYDANNQRYVDSYGGWVNYTQKVVGKTRFACVTP